MANPSLLDVFKLNDILGDLFEDSVKTSPEMDGPSRNINGTFYKTGHRTNIPTVGFRSNGEGVAPVKSTYTQRLVETFVVDASVEVDQATADAAEDGAEAFLAQEASGILEGALRGLSSQFYYGTATTVETSVAGAPTKGFPGLVQTVNSSLIEDVGGTGSSRMSVWGVSWGARDIQWVFGNGGSITVGDPRIVRLTDSNSNPYDGYRMSIYANVGLQQTGRFSCSRIKNITAAATLTDDHFFQLLAKYPAGVRPDAWYITPTALEQLRASRTATSPSGAPVGIIDSVANIPVIVTSGILETENA